MDTVFDVLILAAIAGVVITLGFGLWNLYKGDEASRSRSNKLMRLRVALQATAVCLLIAAMWWKSQGG
ncbi:MAG: twin transmembrane helix small protein [Brevundimonas sp.]|jgi:hypothetical protein|uniref:twin transmembrane helix small protein n=1 Tax=Brevundimonas sp. TaxID=1871086 RepID=UPI00391A7D5D